MEHLDRAEHVVQRRQPVHVNARAVLHEIAVSPPRRCSYRPRVAEQPVVHRTDGKDDAWGESGRRRDHDGKADAARATAARWRERGNRGRLERNAAKLCRGGPNAPGPLGAVCADPKMRLKSAVVELL